MRTDTERINWIIENNADVDAPEAGESSTWVIYTPENSLGAGAGCNRDLRKAIDAAMDGPNAASEPRGKMAPPSH